MYYKEEKQRVFMNQRSLSSNVFKASFCFKEIGGGLFICEKSIRNTYNDKIFTSQEVESFLEEDKVLIKVFSDETRNNFRDVANFEIKTQ